ncbi:MAG: hypothetical protein COY01_02945 [Candidatus Pacebacteria bacterium CG_4_10_14_0_2_um_filter_40_20]|nr:MAG: hypothetical protein COY01_02945 [Candidatus Pacebacteria bacterium CG_4_10_14_0_2_um_filter_40_20]
MNEFTIAIPEPLDQELQNFLLCTPGHEDLVFVLWNPSYGSVRTTALITEIIWPEDGDRIQHGNVSFTQQYHERVCKRAMETGCGVAMIHSHIGPGWQGMSRDDVIAETKIAGSTESLTELPLVGLTLGTDGVWSARFWKHIEGRQFERVWCRNVRVVGSQLEVSFADEIVEKPVLHEMFKRTVSVWGEVEYQNLARLRIGIVGLGSVGATVAEMLARMGFKYFTLIDFDEIQSHNLDRLIFADKNDIGSLKVDVAEKRIKQIATSDSVFINKVPYSVIEEIGNKAALDCDVLFSCVDRPCARKILNHFAYAHLIPVIDGGIGVRFKKQGFSGVDWQVQTASPGKACLECLRAFTSDDASTEEAGMLNDPSYMQGLPNDHHLKNNENVIPFAMNLASLEIFHLIAMVTGLAGPTGFDVQRFRWFPGVIDHDVQQTCNDHCDITKLIARGDRDFTLTGRDIAAEMARERQIKLDTEI